MYESLLLLDSVLTWQFVMLLLVSYRLITIAQVFITRYKPGLRSIPGPWLASISDLDRLWSAAQGGQMNYHLHLHEKYGPLVRIGPKHVSFSDASLIPQIYGITSKFYKSDFYKQFDIKTPTGFVPTIFSVRDEEKHKAIKRPIASAYSMSALKELEPMNDACSAIFMRKLDGLVGQDIDLGTWLHWYAFDVITSITFSNRMDFMEKETDVDNIIEAIEGRLFYNSVIGQAPYLHKYFFGNEFGVWLAKYIPVVKTWSSARFIVAFAAKQLQRYQNKEFNTVELQDMLDRFKRFRDGEQVMSDSELLSHATSNM